MLFKLLNFGAPDRDIDFYRKSRREISWLVSGGYMGGAKRS